MEVAHDVPLKKFAQWLERAKSSDKIIDPTAMCLATADSSGQPSARMILLKEFEQKHEFRFFTNLTSRKGREIIANPRVALCFYWMPLGLQVRVEGKVQRVSDAEADEYFASRRRESRIGAWASKQSAVLNSWEEFQDEIKSVENRFLDRDVSRPDSWSGFRVEPKKIEFWEEGDFRIHKREVYTRNNDGWEVAKLYP